MALDLSDCEFRGPALPEPFVKFELEKELTKHRLLPKTTGDEGKQLRADWEVYRRTLRALAASGGSLRVRNHVLEPLLPLLGYARQEDSDDVQTREDREDGGTLLLTADGAARLRVWATPFDEDLYAPARRGRAYRFSHQRIAQRVLLATGERLGLLTNGVKLLLLLSDPARPDSTVTIPLDPGWKSSRDLPDSFRLLLGLASPAGVKALPELVDKARLQQARVTKDLRKQAREAVEHFIQEILDHPANRDWVDRQVDHESLAKQLWREGLITIYRLLFVLKLETSDDQARSFTFASTALWRNTFSPSMAMAGFCHDVLERGQETGRLLEDGLRSLFRMFEQGLECTELVVKPLGGALFGRDATPNLSDLTWGERAVAWLLDKLLWTPRRRGAETRERVHYGPLDVEDLGRVYEALLELEPGIATEPMCRLRRQKLEVVVPAAQGEKYRPAEDRIFAADEPDDDDADDAAEPETEDDAAPARGKKTKVEWIETIPPGRFFLRVGLGRKASGSYYTPHSFVRFLVQETLGPQIAERSPPENPHPLKILELKVLDPAMGSGHFLVEACRFLGDKLYEACRLCDERALAAERRVEKLTGAERQTALDEVERFRDRITELPDPNDEMLRYLPSRSPEGEDTGYSQARAVALCRRLVATHCLYGVDKNPSAVELAKLAIWLESHAEGMPLTFLDHRLVVGDSLTGPFWDRLLFRPGKPTEPVPNLFSQNVDLKLKGALQEAIRYVRRLEASFGSSVAELREKEAVKAKMDRALLPFRVAAAAWSGGVMLGPEQCDDEAYCELLVAIGETGDIPVELDSEHLRQAIARGLGIETAPVASADLYALVETGRTTPALSYDLTFPEVFYPTGVPHGRRGFHAVLGNPPWDTVRKNEDHFFGMFDFGFLDPPTKREKAGIKRRLLENVTIASAFERLVGDLQDRDRINDLFFESHKARIHGQLAGRGTYDDFMLFAERSVQIAHRSALIGIVLPSAFHSNEGATGIRRLYLEKLNLRHCYSFENRRKLFEIDSRFKFATVVVQVGQPTESFECAFYLHDDEWLFGSRGERPALEYSMDFVRRTGGDYLSLLELRTPADVQVAEACYANGEPFGKVCDRLGIQLGQEVNMTYDAERFTPTASIVVNNEDPRDFRVASRLLAQGYVVLHEGKTFWHYDDHWLDRPRYLMSLRNVVDRPNWLDAARFFRLAFRDIASSTNERTVIFSLLVPPCLVGNTAPTEREVGDRANAMALVLMAIADAFSFDWIVRLKATTHVNLFIINSSTVARISDSARPFLAHLATRLVSGHQGFDPLWREQLGEAWREPGKPPFTWPALATDDERWEVRSAIDAVVADAYGLSRDQYAHVLSTFSHASYKKAPELCLAKFDQLQSLGLEAFTKSHDPYWDIPLNESLPQPVIDLPIPATASESKSGTASADSNEHPLFATHETTRKPTRRKKRPSP